MAWTAPRTWVSLEVVSAALMNTHVRDNLLETAVAKVTTAGDIVYATGASALARLPSGGVAGGVANTKRVMMTSDFVINGSDTLADVTGLVFPVGANETWVLMLDFFWDSGTTPDMKMGLYGPTGVAGAYSYSYRGPSDTDLASVNMLGASVASPFTLIGSGAGAIRQTRIPCYVINGANAGDIKVQAAQNTSNASDTKVRKGTVISGILVA